MVSGSLAWRLVGGRLWQPDGTWVRGEVWIARGRIVARASQPRELVVRGWYVAPGFIDLHLWGKPAARSRAIIRHGTTGFLSTVGPDAHRRWLRQIGRDAQAPTDGAQLLGLHLEGPYLNRALAGALPHRWMRAARLEELRRALRAARGRVRLVTVAPETRGALDAVRELREHRVVASLGHTAATLAEANDAFRAGATTVTHLFNRMRPASPRDPGAIGAALFDERVLVQLICDGVHVAPGVVRRLVEVVGTERIALVTDAVPSATRTRRAAYTRHGRLAGSTLTMMQAVRNMVRWGAATLGEAVRMASHNPARLLGLTRKGSLEVGQDADLVVFDRAYRVRLTAVGGRILYRSGV